MQGCRWGAGSHGQMDPALDGICRVTWEEILRVACAGEIKAALWFVSLSVFDLWAVTRYSPQMARVRLTAHCSPRYHRCHLVTPDSHTPVTLPSDRARSWLAPSSPGPLFTAAREALTQHVWEASPCQNIHECLKWKRKPELRATNNAQTQSDCSYMERLTWKTKGKSGFSPKQIMFNFS